ncbi:MAG: DUF5069 domain-containing protein [Verrucomicrobia bacterium]|nr:DUF5069 domain-containing protein [Verrucomicrobiota bacterium]
MRNYHWPETFREIYDRAVAKYRSGTKSAAALFSDEDKASLATLGCKPQELFDFVEDFVRDNEPSFEIVLLIAAVRREYFLVMQNGVPSEQLLDMDALPPKSAELAGIRWLPRVIEKAKAKLRGEMPDDLMYGCGGDRPFLESVNIEPSEFLRLVWSAEDDTQKIVDYVIKSRDQNKSGATV